MARDRILTGLDIGTTTLQVATFHFPARGEPKALTFVSHTSGGMRRGAIVEPEEMAQRLVEVVDEASRQVGTRLDEFVIGISGPLLRTQLTAGSVAAGKADGEITHDDVERVLRASEESLSRNPNREIFHLLPRSFALDHETGVWDPVGMRSLSLRVYAVVVEGSKSFLKALEAVSKISRFHFSDVVFTPLAAAELILSSHEKEIGTLLIDLGGVSTTYAIFEDGSLAGAGSLSFGSQHITSDIGLGFRVDPLIAERLKCEFGTVKVKEVGRKDVIRFDDKTLGWSKKELAEVIEARVREIFEETDKELKRLGKSGLLPGGCVLYGGGAKIDGLLDVAKSELRIPARLAQVSLIGREEPIGLDFINACALAYWGRQDSVGGVSKRKGGKSFWRFLKSLLP